MKEYPKPLASAFAGVGCCLLIFGVPYTGTYPVLAFLLPVTTTLAYHSTQVVAIVQECEEQHRFAWKESVSLRKNCLYLLAMLFVYSLIIFIGVKIRFG